LENTLAANTFAPRISLATGVLTALQAYLAEEVLVIGAFGIAIALALVAILHPAAAKARWRPVLATGLAGCILGAVLIAPMLMFQLFGPGTLTHPVQPSGAYVTDLENLVIPTNLAWLDAGSSLTSHWVGNASEWTGFIGVFGFILVIWVAIHFRRNGVMRIVGLTSVVLAILSLGPHLRVAGRAGHVVPLPELLLDKLPAINNVLPGRFTLIVAFGFAFACGRAFDWLLVWRGLRRACAALLLGLVAVSLFPTPARPAIAYTIPTFFQPSGGAANLNANTVALVTPVPVATDASSGASMLWQAESNFAFAMDDGVAIHEAGQGYAAFYSDSPVHHVLAEVQGTGDYRRFETTEQRDVLQETLRQEGVNAIISGPGTAHDETVTYLTWLVGAPPEQHGDVAVWTLQ
jgi:hypothetical protein